VTDISRPRDEHTIQASNLHGRSFHRPFDGLLGCQRKLFAIDCQFAKHPHVATRRLEAQSTNGLLGLARRQAPAGYQACPITMQ
jgi:hypothetical protein